MKRIYTADDGRHRVVRACNQCGAESQIAVTFDTDYGIEHGWADAHMPKDPAFTSRIVGHLVVDLCSGCAGPAPAAGART